jgi:hypothetical protein
MDEKSVMWSRRTVIRGRTRGPLKVMRRTATALSPVSAAACSSSGTSSARAASSTAQASGGSLLLGDVTVVAPLREVAFASWIDNTFVKNAAKSNG